MSSYQIRWVARSILACGYHIPVLQHCLYKYALWSLAEPCIHRLSRVKDEVANVKVCYQVTYKVFCPVINRVWCSVNFHGVERVR
jgi:hypothetical protein